MVIRWSRSFRNLLLITATLLWAAGCAAAPSQPAPPAYFCQFRAAGDGSPVALCTPVTPQP